MLYTFPTGTTLNAGEYLIVSNDAATLQGEYPSARIIGNFTGKLSHNGDDIRLDDSSGNLADEVNYRDSGRWPDLASGGGSSLELKDPHADNSLPEAWAASDESSKELGAATATPAFHKRSSAQISGTNS